MTEKVEDLPLGLETKKFKFLENEVKSEQINRGLIEISNNKSQEQTKLPHQKRNIKSKTEYTIDQPEPKNIQGIQRRYEHFLNKADASSKQKLQIHNFKIKGKYQPIAQNSDKTPLPHIRESNSSNKLKNHITFNTKQYKEQMLIRDLQKNPWKYRIPCKMLGCRPDDVFGMKKVQYQFIQQQYKKQKGLQYLRQGNSRIKSSVRLGVKQFKNAKTINVTKEKSKDRKINIKKRQKSWNKKIQKLAQKQIHQGQVVFERVKRYLTKEKQDYFRHLNGEQSVDKALITFLKTKVQRAEMSLM